MENYTRREVDWYGDTRYYNSNDDLHRIDGPAYEWKLGVKEWWIYDVEYSKPSHNRLVLFCILEPQKIDLRPVEEY